jgi:hypothetical protein
MGQGHEGPKYDQALLDALEKMEAADLEALVPLSATEPLANIQARLGLP